MLKLRRLAGMGLMLGAALAVTAAPVLAGNSTPVTGTLSGTEYSVAAGCSPYSPCTASLAGYFSATKGYSGFWNVGVSYTLASEAWTTTTPFTLSTSRGKFTATVMDGTITAGTPQSSFGFCAQPYTLSASGAEVTQTSPNWSNVDFQGVLTDYGIESAGGSCNVFFATVGGTLSFTATN